MSAVQPGEVTTEQIRKLVDSAELVGIFAQRLLAEVGDVLPQDPIYNFESDTPEFAHGEDMVRVRFRHTVLVHEEGEAKEPVGRIEVTHVADLTVEDVMLYKEPVMSAFIRYNIYPGVYTYVRAAIQQLALDVGLPPITLPFLRHTFSVDEERTTDEP